MIGDLDLGRRKMKLHLHARHEIEHDVEPVTINGILGDLRRVTCIRSISASSRSGGGNEERFYSATVLPNFVSIGAHHLDPDSACLATVRFTTQDIATLFHDYEAFGHAFLSEQTIDTIKADEKLRRGAQLAERPDFFYFNGRHEVVRVDTIFGCFRVYHQPTFRMGGTGTLVQNRMYAELAFEAPVDFDTCISRLMSIYRFLSVAAGRRQSIKSIQLTLADKGRELRDGIVIPAVLDLYWEHAPKNPKRQTYAPHPGDVPLTPVRQPDEFSKVLRSWLEREVTWKTARIRLVDCIGKGRSYSIDRLVAVANMFDILPPEDGASSSALSPDLEEARKKCKEIFRKLPDGLERQSVLGALGRMNRPSLTKKVLHHANKVATHLGYPPAELAHVATLAVKLRNYFVHGSLDGINYPSVEPFVPFLTDTLEFIFAASDFIDSGWDARAWAAHPHSANHLFASFRWGYCERVDALTTALTVA
ncbi:hypothetical protein PAMC26577_13370 [Caballeronia sordidicola]|uniref:Uncharacterized protein n=2 Tax=Caballeronia sordidicola TaxID=196367 RepID=A0A242MVD6_CABSO|nr:hypothetical protein PAMC26577_13370 [Caballeronia sordidicola]